LGYDGREVPPQRELRHSFVSLLSSTGLAIEDISPLVGHTNTRVTERERLSEGVATGTNRGAEAMDALFPRNLRKQIGKQGS
jgi:hypothetical protein